MLTYTGTKSLRAKPMTRDDYNTLRGWPTPAEENGADTGYLVEYLDGGEANHADFEGYISWSPTDVFEGAYAPSGQMNFGHALEWLKRGYRVARSGWNGKNMFLYYVAAAAYPAARNPKGTMIGVFPDDMVPYQAYIAMKTVDNTVVPWLCSQTDALASDWCVI